MGVNKPERTLCRASRAWKAACIQANANAEEQSTATKEQSRQDKQRYCQLYSHSAIIWRAVDQVGEVIEKYANNRAELNYGAH